MEKSTQDLWYAHVDSLVGALSQRNELLSERLLRTLQKALASREQTELDAGLVKAIHRLIDMYCEMEFYSQAVILCLDLLAEQQGRMGQNHPALMDTLIRLARVDYLSQLQRAGLAA